VIGAFLSLLNDIALGLADALTERFAHIKVHRRGDGGMA